MNVRFRLQVLSGFNVLLATILAISLYSQWQVSALTSKKLNLVTETLKRTHWLQNQVSELNAQFDTTSINLLADAQKALNDSLAEHPITTNDAQIYFNKLNKHSKQLFKLIQLARNAIANNNQPGKALILKRLQLVVQKLGEEALLFHQTELAQSEKQHGILWVISATVLLSVTAILTWLSFNTQVRFKEEIDVFDSGIADIGDGALKSRISLEGEGELVSLARHFNRVVARLDQSTIAREELEKEVTKQTKTLRAQKEKLEYLAQHDELTGLLVRRAFHERVETQIARDERHSSKAALLFVDLNDFKPINDQHGHDAGDALLKGLATRLKDNLRKSDLIARFGGDEFVLWLDPIEDHDHITQVRDKVATLVAEPIEFDGKELNVSASIGVALFPDDSHTITELINQADEAMYQAKAQHKAKTLA